MANHPQEVQFAEDREDTIENLEAIKRNLQICIDDGMVDAEDHFYNEILDLIDEALIVRSYPELGEVIEKARILEIDMDAWFARHGRTTVSLPWPKIPESH